MSKTLKKKSRYPSATGITFLLSRVHLHFSFLQLLQTEVLKARFLEIAVCSRVTDYVEFVALNYLF